VVVIEPDEARKATVARLRDLAAAFAPDAQARAEHEAAVG
jgi:hypothetical protein